MCPRQCTTQRPAVRQDDDNNLNDIGSLDERINLALLCCGISPRRSYTFQLAVRAAEIFSRLLGGALLDTFFLAAVLLQASNILYVEH